MFSEEEEKSVYHSFVKTMKLNYRCNQKILDKKGLYPGQPALLFSLVKNGPQSQKELAKKLNIKPSTVNVMVKRLEVSGLVIREKDKDDQRISRVIVTNEGERVTKEAIDNLDEMNKEIFKVLNEEEKNNLKLLLSKIDKSLIEFLDKNE